jgi:hypothetical protein
VKILSAVVLVTALAGCATTPPAAHRPQLYPNATFNKIGESAANAEIDACVAKAQAAGHSPAANDSAAAQGAARGGVMGGVAGVVGGLVTGRGIEQSIKGGVASAAVGGAVGAAGGAMRPAHVNPTYRNFVQRCVSEKGLEIIGWN